MRAHQKTNAVTSVTDFLSDIKSFGQTCAVFGVCASTYPLLFMRRLCTHVQLLLNKSLRVIDVTTCTFDQLQAQLAMSFLGQEYLYLLGDCSVLRAPEKQKLYKFLISYRGPHAVIFFIGQQPIGDIFCITLPESLNSTDYQQLAPFFLTDDQARCAPILQKIFSHVGVLSLEQTVQLTDYAQVLGNQRMAFLNQWLHRIIKPEGSLFQLSGALLAANPKSFWQQWQLLERAYEFPFWLAYFSDQFFRAYFYILYKQHNNHELARRASARLPFSFIQRDYKRYTPQKFLHAHAQLCELDWHLKTGGSALTLESIFVRFFE